MEVGQGPVAMTAPIQRFEDLVLSHTLRHDGNPLLKWCVTNAQVIEIPSGSGALKKIKKANYRARIDAVSASLDAMRLYLDLNPGEPSSGYEDYDGDSLPDGPTPLAATDSGYAAYFEDDTP